MTPPYDIYVHDLRPDNHQSLGTLPMLAEDDLPKLQAFYGFELDFSLGYHQARAGEFFWKIAGFELKAGPAVLQPRVHAYDGALITGVGQNILLFLYWPGADPLPTNFYPRYHEQAELGWTEGKGEVGWGFGPESHVGEDGGPFSVWVSSDPADWPAATRRVGSDCVKKLGWWDSHIIPNPIFQVWKKGSDGTPPAVSGAYLVNIGTDGTITGHIPFLEGPPPAGVAALGLARDGAVVSYVPWRDL